MNEDELRQACVKWLDDVEYFPDPSDVEAFARRMQAVGVKRVIAESNPYDNVNDLMDWCEAEATRLEGEQ